MKKSFSVKNREKFQKKQRSFKQEAKAFCFFNSAKICVLGLLEYNEGITKTQKQKAKGVAGVRILSFHFRALSLYYIFVLSLFDRTVSLIGWRFCCKNCILTGTSDRLAVGYKRREQKKIFFFFLSKTIFFRHTIYVTR